MKRLSKLVVLLTVLTLVGLTMGMKAVFAETTSGLDVFSNFNTTSTDNSTATTNTTLTDNQNTTTNTTTNTNTSAASLTVTPSNTTNNTTVVNNINSEVNKIPQTGENDVYIITAIGAFALAIGGVAYFKARKLDM